MKEVDAGSSHVPSNTEYDFEFKAVEDEAGTMIQEVTIDETSIGVFKQIPVGTFYLKEKQSSSEDYVLLDSVIRIESTKDGITAYDEENKLIGEQPAGENP